MSRSTTTKRTSTSPPTSHKARPPPVPKTVKHLSGDRSITPFRTIGSSGPHKAKTRKHWYEY